MVLLEDDQQTQRKEPVMTDTQVNLAQCSFVTDKGRRCKLEAGHATVDGNGKELKNGGHRMMLREEVAKPPTLAELRANGLSLTLKAENVPVNANLGREYSRAVEPRDADQLRVDKDAEAAYQKWVTAGRPKRFEDSAKQLSRYIIPPQAFDTVIAMLRRTVTTGAPMTGKYLGYRRQTHESGNTIVLWRVTDRIVSDEVERAINGR